MRTSRVQVRLDVPPGDGGDDDDSASFHSIKEEEEEEEGDTDHSRRNLMEVLALLQASHNDDLELMLGGELAVTVIAAADLAGNQE